MLHFFRKTVPLIARNLGPHPPPPPVEQGSLLVGFQAGSEQVQILAHGYANPWEAADFAPAELTDAQAKAFLAIEKIIAKGQWRELFMALQALSPADRHALLTAGDPRQPLVHTLLRECFSRSRHDMLTLILEQCPAAALARGRNGKVALHLAAKSVDAPSIALLLPHTGNIDMRDAKGQYALYLLARKAPVADAADFKACVELLRAHRADWTLRVGDIDAAGACAYQPAQCNAVMGLPPYTRCVLEQLQGPTRMVPGDLRALRSSGLPQTRFDLIDTQRMARGAPPLYQRFPDNLGDRTLCRRTLEKGIGARP